ncbi:MAG: hypothetical protein QG597_3855 [Actinomycetota bacterium]|nr:hypothetical protein [Actinomycetota bacterium]
MAHDLITSLRDLVPQRRLSTQSALRLAEQQARLLLRRSGVTEPPIREEIICALPRIEVGHGPTGQSAAASQWSAGRWLILLNERDSRGRRRWSLAHEIKHILDHPLEQVLYPGRMGRDLAERSCEYFAACLLMPAPWLRRIWASGVRDIPLLARRFGVTRAAMYLRLLQLGLIDPTSHHLAREV